MVLKQNEIYILKRGDTVTHFSSYQVEKALKYIFSGYAWAIRTGRAGATKQVISGDLSLKWQLLDDRFGCSVYNFLIVCNYIKYEKKFA